MRAQVVMTTPLGDNACNCAVSSLYTQLEHRDALHAIIKFLHGLCHRELNADLARAFLQGESGGPMGQGMQARGLTMWQGIIQAVISKPPFLIEELAYMIQVRRAGLGRWVGWGGGSEWGGDGAGVMRYEGRVVVVIVSCDCEGRHT
jgi:hypothetical protein